MAVVEVGMMGVQAGKTPMDPNTPDGSLLLDAWKAIITAAGGPQRVYWGTELGTWSRVWGFFDWESVEEHEAFARSFGGEATKRFGEVFTPGFTKHAHFSTAPLSSPVTEVLLISFPGLVSDAEKDVGLTKFQEFRESILDKCADVQGVSAGWGIENDFPLHYPSTAVKPAAGGEQKNGCLFFALIGWESVRAVMEFREMREYEKHIRLLTEMEGCIALSTFHLSCSVLERMG